MKELVFDTTSSAIYKFEKRNFISDGHWIVKYTNGKTKEDFYVKNGVLNGWLSWYWPNGTLMYKAKFKNNLVKKYWYVYGNDGLLNKKYVYEKYEKVKKLYQYTYKCLQSITYYNNGNEDHTKNFKCD